MLMESTEPLALDFIEYEEAASGDGIIQVPEVRRRCGKNYIQRRL